MQVETLRQLSAMKNGERLVVRQDGSSETVVWVCDGKGGFVNGDATLPSASFKNAISYGNVFFPGDHDIGETVLGSDAMVYQVLGREGDTWMLGKCEQNGRTMSIVEGEPLGSVFETDMYTSNTMEILKELYDRRKDADLLNQILAAGEVPTEVEYLVSVEVTGTTEVKPTPAMATKLLGYKDVKVSEVDTFQVSWVSTVEVTHSARWGCACESVTAEDVGAAVRAENKDAVVGSFKILGCAPAAPGKESEVHTAA